MQAKLGRLAQTALMGALENGATVLTANNRLARALKAGYDKYRHAQGERVWQSAGVMPLEIWLQGLLADLHANGKTDVHLPGTSWQLLLWENILEADKNNDGFLNIPAMSGTVQQAWSVAQAYEFPYSAYSGPLSYDQKQFLGWAASYEAFCRRQGMVDPAELVNHLLDRQLLLQSDLPDTLILAGFYEFTPQQLRLFDALQALSIKILQLENPNPGKGCQLRVSPADDLAELEMAAVWSRTRLESDPESRVAIVVPDLDTRKTELEYQLRRYFYPGCRPDQIRQADAPWNFSLGMPLTSCPLVETATLLLKLRGTTLDSNELTRLLLSPFIADGEAELGQRSALDAQEQVRRRLKTGLHDLRHNILTARTAGFRQALSDFADVDTGGYHLPSHWAAVFAALLDNAGWPGDRTLNSEEYQQVEAFRDAVSSLAILDSVSEKIPYHDARKLLMKALGRSVFQSQTRDVSLQILGVLEVTGLSFDAVWVCGMDNDKWPLTATVNPFLPLAWQRSVGAPHASAERELEFSRYLLNQLKNLGEEVLFSHVAMRDENQLQAARAIEKLPVAEIEPGTGKAVTVVNTQLQSVADHTGPAVMDNEIIKGGTGLLAAQAACPFKAFASYRLAVAEIERPTMGIDARDRGNLIHEVLEKFWEETSTSQALAKLSESQIRERLAELATEIVTSENFLLKDYQQRLTQLELNRVTAVATRWLEFEKQRQAFRIDGVETKYEESFDGLQIRMIIDRVDTVLHDDGTCSKVIIDYKSGTKHDPRGWMQERPSEPQLPLYALTQEQEISAISFAVIAADRQEFRGFAENTDLLPGVGLPGVKTEDNPRKTVDIPWEKAVEMWKHNLGALAEEIRDGHAAVLPAKGACEYCKLKPLCRISDLAEEEQ